MAMNEQHYTPKELAKKWHLSVETVRRWCAKHGGILLIDRPESMNKRRYRTIRIPQSTSDEIYRLHFLPSANRSEVRAPSKPCIPDEPAASELNARRVVRSNSVVPAPEINIFSRHSRNCLHRRDKFFLLCDCPKFFSYMDFGMNSTLRSGTRSLEEAEEIKRNAISLVVTGKVFSVYFAITEIRSRILLSVDEAAMELGRSEEFLRKAIERQEIFVWRFGKHAFLNRAELKSLRGAE